MNITFACIAAPSFIQMGCLKAAYSNATYAKTGFRKGKLGYPTSWVRECTYIDNQIARMHTQPCMLCNSSATCSSMNLAIHACKLEHVETFFLSVRRCHYDTIITISWLRLFTPFSTSYDCYLASVQNFSWFFRRLKLNLNGIYLCLRYHWCDRFNCYRK